MNFKPTLWKVIGSIIISIIVSVVSSSSLVFKQKCITKDFEPAGICPGWTTTAILFIGLFFILLTFILIYIIWSLIEEVRWNTKKKRLNLSVSISLILFWISIFMTVGELTSARRFIFGGLTYTQGLVVREYFNILNFISNIYVPLFVSLILSAILFFLIYIVWKILEKNEFFKIDYKKLIVFLIIIFSVIIIAQYYHTPLNPLGLIVLFFANFCGMESCNDAEGFYVLIFSYFIFALISYYISCSIIKFWSSIRSSRKKIDFSKKRKVKDRHQRS